MKCSKDAFWKCLKQYISKTIILLTILFILLQISGGKEMMAMFCYPKEYQLGIRPMKAEDIIEVDNFSELVALDASYADYAEREENEQ